MLNVILNIQHTLNPLHCYCRFIEWGISKKWAMFFCSWYERLVYSWLCPTTIFLVFIARKINIVVARFRAANHLPHPHF